MKDDIKLVLSYIKAFFSKKRFIFLVVGFFLLLGIFTAIFTPKSYQSNTSFLAQVSNDSGSGSGLKSIASLIGLSVGNKTESKDLPVFLYPKIMNSLSYQREVMETLINIKGVDSAITLKEYYTKVKKPDFIDTAKKYTIGLPRFIIGKFRPKREVLGVQIDSLEYISSSEMVLINKLKEDILLTIDEFDGSISIAATMPERIPATQLTESARILLQQKIIDYRIAKAQERYNFLYKEYIEKKAEFMAAQASLAHYTDRNRFNNTQTSLIRKQQLENEYNLAYTVYSELESQRIREGVNLNEDTPVFTTIQPAVVPLESLNPNPIAIIMKFIFIGFLAAIFLYVFKLLFKSFKNIYQSS